MWACISEQDAVVWQEKVILALAEHQASVKTDV